MAVTAASGRVLGTAGPSAAGFNAAGIEKAYKLTGLKSGGKTVAIVDAYGYPGLAKDLAKFRSTNGLPPCTKASGCLTVVNQTGGSSPPRGQNGGWQIEQALDVDAVSAACPDCKILVVEAALPSFSDLKTAENTAAGHAGVVAISNSWGCGCNKPNSAAFNHPGIAITASTGDSGFLPQFPAGDTSVVGVGGTSVFRDGSARGFHETAWAGAGSSCGTNTKPQWQKAAKTTCSKKATADVSAAADPANGGLNVYCGTVPGCGGFLQVGGTSESSPIIAAVYALSRNTASYPAKIPYSHPGNLFDVTQGTNGSCGVPICSARAGWDGPTGMGTPNGVTGF
jgi:subtilase family serine protease